MSMGIRHHNIMEYLIAQYSTKRCSIVLLLLLAPFFMYSLLISGPVLHFVHEDNIALVREIAAQRERLQNSFGGELANPVPKVVHFTWGGKRPMRFHQMVCFLSAYHILKPARINFWYAEHLPKGKWWEYLKRNISNFDTIVSLRNRPDLDSIFGRAVRIPEHKSDIMRLQVLLENGGIYLDLDVLVLKPFDPLLRYETTMGLENDHGLCNGVILCKRNATFLRLWWEEYRTFNDNLWAIHSVTLPFYLAAKYPWMIHVENDTIHRPNWEEMDYLYGDRRYDWHHNYAIHLWYRKYNIEHDLESIKTVDSTFGQIFRYVLFGNPNIT